MGIQITPRSKIRIPIWSIIFGGICLVLLIGFLTSYFYFGWGIKKTSQEIQEKDKLVTPLENAIKEKENELIPVKQKIDDFSQLLSEHKKPINIFEFLQKICLPNVWFSSFGFSETGAVIISGETDNFLTFEHQIFVLRQEPLIKDLKIGGVLMSKGEGKESVNFSFSLTFDPQILK